MAETSITKYVIDYSTIKGIGDAIRAKEGSTELIPIRALKQRILDIQTGIDTSDATAVESEVLAGEIFYANGVKKTGTMTKITGITTELAAGESMDIELGYHDGTGKVKAKDLASQTVGDATAGNILSGKKAWVNGVEVTGNMKSIGAATIMPGTKSQYIDPGVYISGTQTIKGDVSLKAENIKKGSTIFNIPGSYTSDATAAAGDILFGETAYVNGLKVTGTMPHHTVDDTSVKWRLSSVPPEGGDATMVVDVEKGYYEQGSYSVGVLPMYKPSDITPGIADIEVPGGAWFMNGFTVAGDANLVAENIKSGVSIFGVTGSMTDYAFENWTFTLDDDSTVSKSVAVASLEE